MSDSKGLKVNKASILYLLISVVYPIVSIWLLYPDLPKLPAIDKYAVGWFYVPLAIAVLALTSMLFKLNFDSRRFSPLLAQIGLFIAASSALWWLRSERGFAPAMWLNVPLLLVVINDWKERKQT